MDEKIILNGPNRTHNKCYKCGQIKPIDEFVKDKRNPCGHSTLCKKCKSEMDREYHKRVMEDPEKHLKILEQSRESKKRNKEQNQKSWTEYNARPEVKEKKKQWAEEHSIKNTMTYEQYVKEMLRHAKYRAKSLNLPFNLTSDDIVIPEKCPLLNTKLDWKSTRFSNPENVPSLDKIIPEKGYVKGNVAIISMKANTMKQDASIEMLLTFAKNIEKYLNKTEEIVQTVEKEESTESKDKEL